ncbi:MAG: archaeosortase H N-terminal-like domain-containing protein [Candidatus Heimdallarchaeota archaeon]
MEQIVLKKLFIWVALSLNLLFAYIIGLSIPQLETQNSYIFGLVMIPLLIILNYVIIDRFQYHLKKIDDKEEKVNEKD